MIIDRFIGQYRWLSNFAEAPVWLQGRMYPTVEHAYQAAKFSDDAIRSQIGAAATPGMAKKLGRRTGKRPDWDGTKVDVMRGLLMQKFPLRPDAYSRALAFTGDAQLIEGNDWNDTFWGVCRGQGENQLGRLLMERRDALRAWAAIGGEL